MESIRFPCRGSLKIPSISSSRRPSLSRFYWNRFSAGCGPAFCMRWAPRTGLDWLLKVMDLNASTQEILPTASLLDLWFRKRCVAFGSSGGGTSGNARGPSRYVGIILFMLSVTLLTSLPLARAQANDGDAPAGDASTGDQATIGGGASAFASQELAFIGQPTVEEAIEIALELEETWSNRSGNFGAGCWAAANEHPSQGHGSFIVSA